MVFVLSDSCQTHYVTVYWDIDKRRAGGGEEVFVEATTGRDFITAADSHNKELFRRSCGQAWRELPPAWSNPTIQTQEIIELKWNEIIL